MTTYFMNVALMSMLLFAGCATKATPKEHLNGVCKPLTGFLAKNPQEAVVLCGTPHTPYGYYLGAVAGGKAADLVRFLTNASIKKVVLESDWGGSRESFANVRARIEAANIEIAGIWLNERSLSEGARKIRGSEPTEVMVCLAPKGQTSYFVGMYASERIPNLWQALTTLGIREVAFQSWFKISHVTFEGFKREFERDGFKINAYWACSATDQEGVRNMLAK